jgi:cysteine-rich repeat protein/predicted outer membrane repeat protein
MHLALSRSSLLQVVVLLALATIAESASAATITVDSLGWNEDDDGTCTLREAIVSADDNVASGSLAGECPAGDDVDDTIQFSVTGSIHLTSAAPDILNSVTITGPGAELLTLDRQGASGPFAYFRVLGGPSTIRFSGLTIAGADNSVASGGVFEINGHANHLILEDSRFVNNSAASAGVVRATGPLTIRRCSFVGNTAAGTVGGAINVFRAVSPATVVIDSSSFVDNSAMSDGGAIYYNDTVDGSRMSIVNSTFVGNRSMQSGGAIFCKNAIVELSNSTVSGNTANVGVDPFGDGGGLAADAATCNGVNLRNSVVADNVDAGGNDDFPDCAASVTSFDYNLFGSLAGCAVGGGATHDQVASALLDSVGLSGGTTPTMVPLAGSPVIDGGNPAGCSNEDGDPITLDQRGYERPAGAACDIGAVEVVCPNGIVEGDEDCDDGNTTAGDGCSATCTSEGPSSSSSTSSSSTSSSSAASGSASSGGSMGAGGGDATSGAGGSDAAVSSGAGANAMAPGDPPVADDGGCALAGSARPPLAAIAAVLAALVVGARPRRRREDAAWRTIEASYRTLWRVAKAARLGVQR